MLARLSWSLIHMELESFKTRVPCLHSLFSFPIFLLFLVRVVPRPRMSSFFDKTNKSHSRTSFPVSLLFSTSPTHLYQTSKAPKNPRTKPKTKTNWIGNPNPKIKKNTLWWRRQGSKRSQHRWTTALLVLISIQAAITALIRCIAALCLSVCIYFVVEVEMGLLFVVGLWGCLGLLISLFLSEFVSVDMLKSAVN